MSGQTKPENEEKGVEEGAGLALFIVSLGGVLALTGAIPESSVQYYRVLYFLYATELHPNI